MPLTLAATLSLALVPSQLQQLPTRSRRQQPHLRINPQLVARIDNIQIAHRQLANSVRWRKAGLAFFHRQPLGVISQVA